MNLRSIYYNLSPSMRLFARRLYYLPIDLFENISGKRDELTPPRGMIYTGSGDFRKQGLKHLKYFIELCNLKPEHSVLDVGSGIGRMAIPIASYLNENGSYEGFDVVRQGVNWCNRKITPKFPNFRFQFINLNNDLYTSDGRDAATFKFPYKDNQFDLVILTSVFTHMLPDQVVNYLSEIYRVMKTGGRCFATFFILNEASEKLMSQNDKFRFPFEKGDYALMDENVQSANVAFKESFIENVVLKAPFTIQLKIYGTWCGRIESGNEFQDIYILKKV